MMKTNMARQSRMMALTIAPALITLILAAITANYPGVQDLQLSSTCLTIRGQLVVSGSLTMYYSDEIYPNVPNQFYWFNQWWQQQVGQKIYGLTLVSITWTLLEHSNNYDKLAFKLVLK